MITKQQNLMSSYALSIFTCNSNTKEVLFFFFLSSDFIWTQDDKGGGGGREKMTDDNDKGRQHENYVN